MDAAAIVKLIGQYGFAVVVCVWFMFRLEKRLERLSSLVSRLAQTIAMERAARQGRVVAVVEEDVTEKKEV